MKNLFRFHRGSLADSLATTIEVTGLAELQKRIEADFPQGYLRNIRIKNRPINDNRLPEEWGGVSYYVVADFDGYKGQCIGMSNFYEELKLAYTNPTGSCGTQITKQGEWRFWDKRSKEEREADRREDFLKEFSALLRKYDARINAGCFGWDNENTFFSVTLCEDTIEWTQGDFYNKDFRFPLTADNVLNFDK